MSDDKSKTSQDSKLISLTEDYEMRDWTKSLGCAEAELRAVAVGNSAANVGAFLRKK
jgi:hypothetical protein